MYNNFMNSSIKNYFWSITLFYLDAIFITFYHIPLFSLSALYFIHSFFTINFYKEEFTFHFLLFFLQLYIFFSNINYLFIIPFIYFMLFCFLKKYMIITNYRFLCIKMFFYLFFLYNIFTIKNVWLYSINILLCFVSNFYE